MSGFAVRCCNGLNQGRAGVFLLMVVLLIGLAWPAGAAVAEETGTSAPIQIRPGFKQLNICDRMDFLLDPTGDLDLQDVMGSPYDAAFRMHTGKGFNFGLAGDVIWLRFRLQPDGAVPPGLIPAINKPLLDVVDLFLPQPDGAYAHFESGSTRYSRPDFHGYRYTIFTLPDDLAAHDYCYLRLDARITSAVFRIYLFEPSVFQRTAWLEIAFYYFILGILAAMVLYNLILAIFLADRTYFYYVGYVGVIGIYCGLRSGALAILGIPLAGPQILLSVAVSFAFFQAFSQAFLSTGQHCPRIHKILSALIGGAVVTIFLTLAGYPMPANKLMHALGLTSPIVVVVASFIRLSQGFRPVRYYLGAWLFLAFGTLSLGMRGTGLLADSFLSANLFFISTAIEAVLLSTALAERIRELREEGIELKRQERRLTDLAIKDELTGLYNKRWFDGKIKAEVAMALDLEAPLALLVLDVDHFKRFNDAYGHARGDKVLQGLGRIITNSLRENDIPCRYGGEEFAIILPGTDEAEAVNIAQRLRTAFAGVSFETGAKNPVNVTISIGVAVLGRNDTESTLFERSDQALYRAKSGGRNRVEQGQRPVRFRTNYPY